jgi:hypothetical protein
MVRKARNDLSGAYPSLVQSTVPDHSDHDGGQDLLESQATDRMDDHSCSEAQHGNLQPAAPQESTAELLYAAIRNPYLIQQHASLSRAVSAVIQFQATVRGVRIRRRYRALLRLRRQFNTTNVSHQFRWWRAEARATTFRKRHLATVGITGLQANANVRLVRRQKFAHIVASVRRTSTLRRALVVWHRYVKYLAAPVADGRRDVSFEYEFLAWNRFLVMESQRLNIQAKCALFGGGKDPILVVAHYVYRWRRYVSETCRDRNLTVIATTHHEIVSCRKHFSAWVNFVSFQAQREAWQTANTVYYFARWRRGVKMQIAENLAIRRFANAKKLTVLSVWRRKALAFRERQASGVVLLQSHKPLLTKMLARWTMAPDATYAASFAQWRAMVQRRRLWKAFVSSRWSARAHHLKSAAFTVWAKVVADAQDRPLRLRKRCTTGLLDLGGGVHDDFQQAQFRCKIGQMYSAVHASTEAVDAATKAACGSVPAFGPNLFEKDCGQLSSRESLRRERETVDEVFGEWTRVTGKDIPLGHAVMPLLVSACRKFNSTPVRSFITQSAQREADGEVSQFHSRWNLLRQIVVSVGEPLIASSGKDVVIRAIEQRAFEDTLNVRAHRLKFERRLNRVNKRTSLYVSTSNVVRVDRYFDAFSPFRMLMERYEEMARAEPKKYKRGRKITVPLAPVPIAKHLKFILRFHLGDIIGEEGRQRICVRRIIAARVALVVAHARLAFFLQSSLRGDPSHAQKRLLVASSFNQREARELSSTHLESTYRRVVPRPRIPLPPVPDIGLDTLGFNPKWLRGDQQRRVNTGLRLRKAMRRAAESVDPFIKRCRDSLQRSVSFSEALSRSPRMTAARANSFHAASPPDAATAVPQRAAQPRASESDGLLRNGETVLPSEARSSIQRQEVQPATVGKGTHNSTVSDQNAVEAPEGAVRPPRARSVESDAESKGSRSSRSESIASSADSSHPLSGRSDGIRGSPTDASVPPTLSPRTSLKKSQPTENHSSKTAVVAVSATELRQRTPPKTAQVPLQHETGGNENLGRELGVGEELGGTTTLDTQNDTREMRTKLSAAPAPKRSTTQAKPVASLSEVRAVDDGEELAVTDVALTPKNERSKANASHVDTSRTARHQRVVKPKPVATVSSKARTSRPPQHSDRFAGHHRTLGTVVEGAVPPPAVCGDRQGDVPSVERLIEVASRHSTHQINRARSELDALKMDLARLVDPSADSRALPVADPVSARVAQEAAGAIENTKDDVSPRLERLREYRENRRSQPLVPQHEVLFPSASRRGRSVEGCQPADHGADEVASAPPGTVVARRARHQQEPDVVVTRDFTRSQLVRVPREVAPGAGRLHSIMHSTAALLNATATNSLSYRQQDPVPPMAAAEALDALQSQPRKATRRLSAALAHQEASTDVAASRSGSRSTGPRQGTALTDAEVGRLVGYIVRQSV